MSLDGFNIFRNRTVVVATMHGKEAVFAPILEREFGLKCKTLKDFNTDVFGTFTGEIERMEPAGKALKRKAMAALEQSNETLVVASEGSFGSHPSYLYVPANEEMVILLDKKYDLEIRGWHLTVETNFNHRDIENIQDLKGFISRIGFPNHGIILHVYDGNNNPIILKDFKSTQALLSKTETLLKSRNKIRAETDMRAMRNPTRRLAIAHAVRDLIKNVKSCCPICGMPGFAVNEVVRGLPCSLCGYPTRSIKAYMYYCKKCDYYIKKPREGILNEDPAHCDVCNP